MKFKYLIIGAGPGGLGIAWHLQQKGIKDWLILEKESYAGGLAASFRDKEGFCWDLGGHVIFGNNPEFIAIVKKVLGRNLKKYQRRAAIFFENKFIPYPFQDNFQITRSDLAEIAEQKPRNFQEWLYATFGKTLSEIFFIPQNQKSWVYPLDKMSFSWIKKRIKLPTLASTGSDPIQRKKKWGGNAVFYYPQTGGIGRLWQKLAESFKDKIKYKSKVVKVDYQKKSVYLKSGQTINYQHLLSTMPLDLLLKAMKINENRLKHNRGLVIGLGIQGRLAHDYHWLYYPQKPYPFFRLVFPSNFSQVDAGRSAILAEISLKDTMLSDRKKQFLITNSIESIIKLNLFKGKIISRFNRLVEYFYPIPTLDRDQTLAKINKLLNRHQIFSLGRFGGWKYEEGNMDDAFMKGPKSAS